MKIFPAVRIEGGLFAPDLLDKLLEGELPGQKPSDFGLNNRRNLTDEIAAVFADAQKLWQEFKDRLDRLPDTDPATSVTRDKWVIPFLRLLGYELRYNHKAYEIGGLKFAISHRAGEAEDAPPVHIVGVRQDLGRRAESGRSRLAPHALVQEYLNCSDALWGLVTNGRVLRLLRDSTYIRRQAYVEFDLEAIFEQRLFQDFAVLYRLLHCTRLPESGADAHQCLLEQYYQYSVEQGGRVRDRLRDGVEKCIKILANGFLSHPANGELRASIASSEQRAASGGGVDEPLTARHSPLTAYRLPLTPEEFYHQLLRLVYRFLFLLVAEDRGLISQNRLYLEHYSVSRFRRLVDNRAAYTDHDDLWLSLRVLWRLLSDDTPVQEISGRPLASLLDLPVLDGELFEPLDLDGYRISNRDLLGALWHLINYRETPNSPPRRVNYAALDVEELGSVYESLLDYHPYIDTAGTVPRFDLVFGSERKSTGSYYTPAELVDELIRSTLDPVIEEKLMSSEQRAVSSDGSALTEEEKRYVYQVLSRSSRLAKRHGLDQTDLSTDTVLSQGGDLRSDLADSASSDIDSGKHRRGVGQTVDQGIPTIPPHRPGEPARTGDPSPIGASSGPGSRRPGPASSTDVPGHWEAADQPPAQPFNEEAFLKLWQSLPLAARRSLLAEHSLLSIRVLDPASGSGHFLLAAARRLGKKLAEIRSGEEEPPPEKMREAVRDVISHCIYGVDKNPLAVELCKVALWIEAHTPGKPLTFLDHHIRCGDSLVGVFNLEVLKEGIPDDAFKPVSGDEKGVARNLKKRNKEERRGRHTMFTIFDVAADLQVLSAKARTIDSIRDDTPEGVRQKERFYRQFRKGTERSRVACDLWTAAFFQPLFGFNSPPITTGTLLHYLETGQVNEQTLNMARKLAEKHRFFHWPLEFPEVFEKGGFDVVLSNPPWEVLQPEETKFFATRNPQIANLAGARRKAAIQRLSQTNTALAEQWNAYVRDIEATNKFVRISVRFPLTASGKLNTYSLFAELARRLIAPNGRAGIIVPTGIATDDTNKHFFIDLVQSGNLVSLFDFENREKLFPAVDSRYKFSLLTIRSSPHSPLTIRHSPSQFAFFCTRAEHLLDDRRRFTLTPEDFILLNPNTRTCPVFRTRPDSELTKAIYRRVPVLVNEAKGENPWGITFRQGLFNMTSDSHLFRTREQLEAQGFRLVGNRFVKMASGEQGAASRERASSGGQDEPLAAYRSLLAETYLPLYEAKMIWQFDHRFGTYEGVSSRSSTHLPTPTSEQHADPSFVVQPWYWVPAEEVEARLEGWKHGWLLGFRRIARATDERTGIFSLLPHAGAGDNVFLLFVEEKVILTASLLANNLSMVFDYAVRQKIAGVNMNFFFVKQLPVLPPSAYTPKDLLFIVPRVLELVYTAWDLKPFADDVWREADEELKGAIARQWFENRRETGGVSFELPEWARTCPEITPVDPGLANSDHSPFAIRHSPTFPFPPFKWDEERRARIRAELDAYYARLYGLNRKQLRYILDPADLTERELEDILDPWEEVQDPLDPEGYRRRSEQSTFPGETFRVLKEKEIRQYGEYRTRRLVLEAWERYDELRRGG